MGAGLFSLIQPVTHRALRQNLELPTKEAIYRAPLGAQRQQQAKQKIMAILLSSVVMPVGVPGGNVFAEGSGVDDLTALFKGIKRPHEVQEVPERVAGIQLSCVDLGGKGGGRGRRGEGSGWLVGDKDDLVFVFSGNIFLFRNI